MSTIEWTDRTINPVAGCTPVSPACDHCYAARRATLLAANPLTAKRYEGVVHEGAWTGRINLCPEVMEAAVKRQVPTTYFVGSMSDLFHPSVPLYVLDKIFAYMCVAPQHTFQLLTKRSKRMRDYVSSMYTVGWKRRLQMQLPPELQKSKAWRDCHCPVENVWLGVTVEDQRSANTRIFDLLKTPAAVHFVSIEPMLGPIDLTKVAYWNMLQATENHPALDWVICGGETGPGARPMHPDWARSLRDQCTGAGVPFFFKQWGEFKPLKQANPTEDTEQFQTGDVYAVKSSGQHLHEAWIYAHDVIPWPEDMWWMDRVGKKTAGRLLDGVAWEQVPGGEK